jgi:hypothetical protein
VKALVVATLTLLICQSTRAGILLDIEGSCSGALLDGTSVSYTYYSNYDGCRKVSRAAITFTSGLRGHYRGKRSFTTTEDIYSFRGGFKLIFANSTGNTSGTLVYPDEASGEKKFVTLQCSIRNNEYADC